LTFAAIARIYPPRKSDDARFAGASVAAVDDDTAGGSAISESILIPKLFGFRSFDPRHPVADGLPRAIFLGADNFASASVDMSKPG
jgi:hypothetical protein